MLSLSAIKSLCKIKDFIIEALHEKNSKLHQAIEKLESQVSVLKTDPNNLDQNNKSKKLDIHGIPDSVSYKKLEEKVTENLDQIDFRISTNNIDNCHDIGKLDKSTIIFFVNRTGRQFN